MDNTGIKPEDCPTPYYHETHRYCPSCDWDETMETPTAIVSGHLPADVAQALADAAVRHDGGQ